MNSDRDMFYSGYGYGYGPMPNMMPSNPINNAIKEENNYLSSINQDINNRVSRLERQVQRLEQRITRLETPYQNNYTINNEPDSNMYMM